MFATHKNDNNKLRDACHMAKETGQKAREILDHASHEARDAIASTEKQIREHPVKASAIAAGIGFLLGALFRRR